MSVLCVGLLNVTVDPVPVNVPAVQFQFPPTEIGCVLVLNVPSVLVKMPLMSNGSCATTLSAALLIVRFVNDDPCEVMFCVLDPVSVTVDVPAENVPLVSVQLRNTLIVEALRLNVPPLMTTLLVMVTDQLFPVSKVPAAIVKLPVDVKSGNERVAACRPFC